MPCPKAKGGAQRRSQLPSLTGIAMTSDSVAGLFVSDANFKGKAEIQEKLRILMSVG